MPIIENKADYTDNQYVAYLSPTFYDSVHGEKNADESECQYPDDMRLRQNCGFQGYAPECVTIVMPFKKPRSGELTEI